MKKRSCMCPAAVMFILMLSLCTMGVGYARWSEHLVINGFVSSGLFHIVFDKSRPCSIEIVDLNGMSASGAISANNISCTLNEEKKQAQITFDHALLLEELASGDKFLKFRYPLSFGEDSTVQSVVPYAADLTVPSQEKVEFTPTGSRLIINGEEYMLPSGLLGPEGPLYWDVYRQIEANGEQIAGTIYLKLSAESMDCLNCSDEFSVDVTEIPEELIMHIVTSEDETDGLLQAELNDNYSFSISLFVEQGHP